ncbi:MAG: chromate transporter [Lachnospiraceae bacterium]|nr:chromate transporter [Lachnospiraceae bacterium]
MNIYPDLFLTFAKIGVMTFGGGMAMLPMLEREVVENKGWCTEEELMDYFAIGQCTPGIIAVNTATFIGKKMGSALGCRDAAKNTSQNELCGILGGIIATLGMVFPSIVIITVLSAIITQVQDIAWINHAFAGIRICVCILIINAAIKLGKKALVNLPTVIIFIVVFLGAVFTDLSPVIFVILAALAGILLQVKKS